MQISAYTSSVRTTPDRFKQARKHKYMCLTVGSGCVPIHALTHLQRPDFAASSDNLQQTPIGW